MQSLNQLVMSGKVLYIGVSDTPGMFSLMIQSLARHLLRVFLASLDRFPSQRVRATERNRSIRRVVSVTNSMRTSEGVTLTRDTNPSVKAIGA